MRTPGYLAAALITAAAIGMTWGAVSAGAVPTDTPTPTSTGSSQIGFTVVDTASPTPTPTSTRGGGSGGSGGGSGGSGGGGTPPPVCVPVTKTPSLTVTPVKPSILHLTPKRVSQGEDVLVQGDGFQAGEKVVIGLLPTAVNLGTFTVRTNGQVYSEVTIPRRTQLGDHAIVAIGYVDCHIGLGAMSVVSPHGSGSSTFPWIVWVITGSALGLAGVGILIAFLLGWLPLAGATGVATRVVP